MYIVDGLIFSISVTTLAAIIGIILKVCFSTYENISKKLKTLNIFATSFIDIIKRHTCCNTT